MYALHTWAGVATGALFLVIALTGTLLIFLGELNLRGHRPIPAGAPLTHYAPALADLLTRHPGSTLLAIYVPVEAADRKTWQVFLRKSPADETRIVADLDPTTGRIVAERDFDATAFRFVLKLHYSFLAGTVGEIVAWLVSVALVVLSLSGFWIYRGAIRDLFRWRVRREASLRGNTAWLHKWTGLWALALAVVWGVTGFIYMLVIVPRAFQAAPASPLSTDVSVVRGLADLPRLHTAAQASFPGRPLAGVRLIARPGAPAQLQFRFLFRDGWPWNKFGLVTADAATGAIARVDQPHELPVRDRFFAAVATLHFGFLGGRWMQVMWGLGGLVMIFLPVSGYVMWALKRRRRARGSAPGGARRPAVASPRDRALQPTVRPALGEPRHVSTATPAE